MTTALANSAHAVVAAVVAMPGGPPSPFTDPLPEPAAPALTMSFSEVAAGIQSFAFVPGKDAVYVLHAAPVIDLWGTAVSYWPELGGACVVLSVLVALVVARRLLHRPQVRGVPTCRRCNYNLEGHTGARCPECGVDLAKRPARPGRSFLRRWWVSAAPMLLLGGAYAWALAAGVPRDGWLTQKYHWCSAEIGGLVKGRVAFLAPRLVQGYTLLELRLPSGAKARRVLSTSHYIGELSVSPDGSTLVVGGRSSGEFEAYSLRSGMLLAHATLAEADLPRGAYFVGVVTYSADSSSAFVEWQASRTQQCGVLEWNYHVGSLMPRLSTMSSMHNDIHFPRRFQPLDSENSSFLSAASSFSASPRGFRVHRLRQNGAEEHPLPSFDGIRIDVAPVRPDGTGAFAIDDAAQKLVYVSLTEPPTATPLYSVESTITAPPVLSRDGSMLVVPTETRVLVRDLHADRWLAVLQPPAGAAITRTAISEDGRWVASEAQMGTAGYHSGLIVWDLDAILRRGTPRTSAPHP